MDINKSPLSRFMQEESNKPGIARSASETKAMAEAAKLKESTASTASGSQQLELKEGQIIKGQIIDHRYNEVRVQIEPGRQVVTAKLSGDIPLSIGQEAQFQVKEGSAERIVLKYIPNEATTSTDTTIQKALTASGLAMTERNKALVAELLDHTMPVDKQTLQTLIKLSYQNREAAPLTLVLMYKNQIPLTSANIKQFESYQNGANQLLGDIHTITKNLSELLKLSNSNIASSQNNYSANISGIALNQGQEEAAATLINNATLQAVPLQPALSQTDPSQAVLQNNTNLSQTAQQTQPSQSSLNMIDWKTTSLVMNSNLQSNELQQWNEVLQINEKLIDLLFSNSEDISSVSSLEANPPLVKEQEKQTLPGSNTAYQAKNISSAVPSAALPETTVLSPSAFLEQPELLQNNPGELAAILNPEERAALLKGMTAFPASEQLKNQITDGTASIKEVLTFIRQTTSQTEASAAQILLQAPEYSKLIESAFRQKWTITPEKLAQKDSVAKLYQSLQEDLEKLNELAKTIKGEKEAQLQEPVKNMQENLHFMKDLNEMFTYVQLPIQLKDQNVHSDLYVFTKKKALQDKKGNLSVLLHLDMDNLGPLNIYIQLEQKQIQAKFYLSDSETENLLSENISSLTEGLQKKGYSITTELINQYERPDFSKDFIEQSTSDNYIQQYTFDIRT